MLFNKTTLLFSSSAIVDAILGLRKISLRGEAFTSKEEHTGITQVSKYN